MPIVSRQLELVQPSVSGTVLASFLATDGDRVKDRAVALDDAEATFDDIVSIG